MFIIKTVITFCAASSALYQIYAETEHEIQKRTFVEACPYTLEFQQLQYVFDSRGRYVIVDQRGKGQRHQVAVCQNNTGPSSCPSCCIGSNTRRYNSKCKTLRSLQSARVCDTADCANSRRARIYVDTACTCYYQYNHDGTD